MEVFLKSILYLLTFAGAAAVVSFYISDIHMNRKRFRWYYYLPAAAVFAVLGGLCSHIFVWWLYLLSEAGSVSVLLLLGYLILIIGCLIGFALLFRRFETRCGIFAALSGCAQEHIVSTDRSQFSVNSSTAPSGFLQFSQKSRHIRVAGGLPGLSGFRCFCADVSFIDWTENTESIFSIYYRISFMSRFNCSRVKVTLVSSVCLRFIGRFVRTSGRR